MRELINLYSARLNSKFNIKYGRIDVVQNSQVQKVHGQLFGQWEPMLVRLEIITELH